MALSGNKGDWSEIYVLLKLLADGKLYSADENLERVEDAFYPILRIIRKELENERHFVINGSIKLINGKDNSLISDIPTEIFITKASELFNKIKNAKGMSFRFPEFDDFLCSLDINSLKAKSQDKSDIKLVVHDIKTGTKPTFGFSIKSLIGKDSTLFNAGAGTNFIFEITHSENIELDYNKLNEETIEEEPRIQTRILKLESLGYTLKFHSIQSERLSLNLRLIDSNLPEILAYSLYYSHKFKVFKLYEIVKLLNIENPLKYNFGEGHPFYEYKLKNLLSDNALGMTPEKVWKGDYDATGGIILVKDDGEVLCYHIYNRNDFHEYLINNTKFERASMSESRDNPGTPRSDKNAKPFRYGWVYKENSKLFIKINLQIRFTN